MKTLLLIVLTAMFSLLSISVPPRAMDPLPSRHGVSKLHPGDQGILWHPAVLHVEDFESPTLEDLKPRRNEIENHENKVLELVSDHPKANGVCKSQPRLVRTQADIFSSGSIRFRRVSSAASM